MVTLPSDGTGDLHDLISRLRAERDAALAEKASLTKALADRGTELAQRKNEYTEQIGHQSATLDVLKAMAASPDDAQPVFDLIVRRACELCSGKSVGLFEFDGRLVHQRATFGEAQERYRAFEAMFPMEPARASIACRAILDRQIIHIHDMDAEPDVFQAVRDLGGKTTISVPLLREGAAIGALSMNTAEKGGFSDSQIELLKTFAEQAVIAISSAEAYRALHGRTSDLQEALEQQIATAEVLGVINASPGNLVPVFDAILEKAHTLCGATLGSLVLYDGINFHATATQGYPEEYAAVVRQSQPPSRRTQPLIDGERFVHVLDLKVDEEESNHEVARNALRRTDMRTALWMPLRKDGSLLGFISAYRNEVRAFTNRQIALLENFASQAVIAMENARLLTEQRETLEQQTATAEVLQVINSSPGDLVPVFDAMLEKAMRLCGAAFGSFYTYDGERLHSVAQRGVPPAYAEYRANNPIPIRPGSGIAQALGARRPHKVLDLAATEAYAAGEPAVRAMVELGGVRTLLSVPLCKGETVVGLITIYRQEVREFAPKQIALLENFAAQAVIAMENARLITEQREALEQQTATAEILQVINAFPGDLTPVFDSLLERAMRLCGAAFGSLYTYDGERFHSAAQRGVPAAYAAYRMQNPPLPTPGNGPALLLQTRKPVHTLDVADTYRPLSPGVRAMVELGGIRTVLAVPLVKDDVFLGFITIYRQEVRAFSQNQITLLEHFAAQAVIAIENARLINETREALDQQTATAEVLQVINSSPGELVPVLDAMLERAMRLCGGTIGGIFTFEENRSVTRALQGVTPAFAVFQEQYPIDEIQPGTVPARIIDTRRPVQNPDVKAGEAYRNGIPYARALLDLGNIRAVLAVPLLKDGVAVGMIALYREETGTFADKRIAILENFAAQAVIAMESARLLRELRQRTDQVAELNRGLEARVAEQVEELGRVGRLKRFLAPQLAELIVSQGNEQILESHRREIVVVFCDLRGYTAFTETAEPEEVLDFLREYHGALGPLVAEFEGTLDQFSGDGIMVFFNDPVPIPNPAERAVNMAMAMRAAAGTLIADWRERGRDLGFGVGIAQGYATLGQIGFSERSGYTAIGTVCNVAARLCAEARDGQILLSQRVNAALRGSVSTEQVGALALKGLTQPVVAYNVPLGTGQSAFRVIEGGAPSA